MADPVSTIAATVAAANAACPGIAATAFQTTLLLLYFVTPAVNTHGENKKEFETKAIWTLQATSQIPFEDSTICSQLGTKLINQFRKVYTVTLRAYCLCPHGDGSKVCFNNQNEKDKFITNAIAGRPRKSEPTIIPLGPIPLD
jgi:hypothetical protein